MSSKHSRPPEIIEDLEEFMETLRSGKFSADNISPQSAKYNHSLIKKVEKILDYQNVQEIREYFDKTEMSSDFLTHYLYNLQAIATYYMYNMYDSTKAKEILLRGKELAELYVNNRNRVRSNFNELTNAEIFSELQMIDDLPQIYTRIIYSLGRTYVYDSDNILAGQKYFELAKYLGDRLQLFEGYLSDISGILVIKKELANLNIKEGNTESGKETLLNIIDSYIRMRDDANKYIENYKPGIKEQQIIIPKNQSYNLFVCNTQIISNYTILLSHSKNAEEIKEYVEKINIYLTSNASKNLLRIANTLSQKKIASLYNILGDIMTTIRKLKIQHNIEVKDSNIKKNIATILSSNSNDDLELAEELFNKAKDVSRSGDFTKADAYYGLVETYQLKLRSKDDNLTSQQRQDLQNQINSYLQKAEHIDRHLNRRKNRNF